MTNRKLAILHMALLTLIACGVIALNLRIGYLASTEKLAIELSGRHASLDAPQEWALSHSAAMRYRLLFKAAVTGTWALLTSADDGDFFYFIYLLYSTLFMVLSTVMVYLYLTELEFWSTDRLVGTMLWLFSCPILFAYVFPVHTREDTLAYTLVLLALIAAFRGNTWAVAIFSTAAVLTREMTLIVSLIYFLFGQCRLRARLVALAAPISALVGVRVAMGWETYDPLSFSRRNVEFPLESLAFVFVSFGVLWLPAFLGWWSGLKVDSGGGGPWRLISRSFPLALMLIVGASLALGRLREIRLLFLLFPWVLPLALRWLVRSVRPLVHAIVARPSRLLATMVLGVGLAACSIYVSRHNPSLAGGFQAFHRQPWPAMGWLHAWATCLLLGSLFRARVTQRPDDSRP